MSSLFAQAQAHRRALLDHDAAAAGDLVEAYGAIYVRIQERFGALAREIEAARARGETVNPAWLRQRDRLNSLLRQVAIELENFNGQAFIRIAQAQGAAISLAESHVAATLATVGVSYTRLPIGTINELVGRLAPGAPLNKLLNQLAPAALANVRQSLITGVALGHNPRKIASDLRTSLGGNLTHALTLSRTATVGAYRSATLGTYQANSDVVKGWRWVCAKSTRTCLACLLRDGQIFPLTKPMPAHWNCRCVMLPVTDEEDWRAQSGPAWFAAQAAETQREMLGLQAYELYAEGKLELSAFLGHAQDRHLGAISYQRSLREVLARRA
jgi:SPP1 gp7 family putative phage head morphogenesis protein